MIRSTGTSSLFKQRTILENAEFLVAVNEPLVEQAAIKAAQSPYFTIAATPKCPNGEEKIIKAVGEQAWLAYLKNQLGSKGINGDNLQVYLDDFQDRIVSITDNAGVDALLGDIDPDVWKKFASIPGDTKTWVRKSVDLQEWIKAKGFTDADVDKLKNFYNRHLSSGDKIFPTPKPCPKQCYDAFGFPDFTNDVIKIRKKDGSGLGRASYEPPAGITKIRNTDAKLANEWAAANFHPDDFRYSVGSNKCEIKDTNGNWIEHTWHHHQDGKTMMAVPKTIHDNTNASHIGGVQAKEEGIEGFFDSPVFPN